METPPPLPRSLFCGAWGFFPRVFAAGAVAADSQGFVEDRELRSNVSDPGSPESGWDRLRQLFTKDEQQRFPKEIDYICRAAVSAGIIGWAYGGIPAFIYAKKRYIEQSQAEIYHNRFDAVQSAHRAAMRGFIRYGWRWSWRTAVFVTIFNTVNTGLTVYRDKDALSHFAIAGGTGSEWQMERQEGNSKGVSRVNMLTVHPKRTTESHTAELAPVTGGLFRINLGVRGLVAGSIIGALLGAPMGSLLIALEKHSGETVQERRQKDRKALHEQRLEEWRSSLRATELLPMEIESGLEKIQPEEDAQRIEALLSLPRNPSSPDKHSKD